MAGTEEYFGEIDRRYAAGSATEHTYRGALGTLLESMDEGISATNEPRRIECGAPDYIVSRRDVPVGYVEAKDIGVDLRREEKSTQLKRYREALPNLILTD